MSLLRMIFLECGLYVLVGCGEWYLALRRTLACARGEKALMITIVFVENFLGLWVLSNFVETRNWFLALAYSGGGALGALLMSSTQPTREQPEHPARPTPVLSKPQGVEVVG